MQTVCDNQAVLMAACPAGAPRQAENAALAMPPHEKRLGWFFFFTGNAISALMLAGAYMLGLM